MSLSDLFQHSCDTYEFVFARQVGVDLKRAGYTQSLHHFWRVYTNAHNPTLWINDIIKCGDFEMLRFLHAYNIVSARSNVTILHEWLPSTIVRLLDATKYVEAAHQAYTSTCTDGSAYVAVNLETTWKKECGSPAPENTWLPLFMGHNREITLFEFQYVQLELLNHAIYNKSLTDMLTCNDDEPNISTRILAASWVFNCIMSAAEMMSWADTRDHPLWPYMMRGLLRLLIVTKAACPTAMSRVFPGFHVEFTPAQMYEYLAQEYQAHLCAGVYPWQVFKVKMPVECRTMQPLVPEHMWLPLPKMWCSAAQNVAR